MAGGKKINAVKLAEKRDNLLKKANIHFLKSRKLEEQAEDIDAQISDQCIHPKKHRKLKNFSGEKTFWLCTICYQSISVGPDKNENQDTAELSDESWECLPENWLDE